MKTIRSIQSLFLLIMMLFSLNAFSAAENTFSDAAITAAVKSKIMLNTSIANYNVEVTTNNGVVNLNGRVNTDTEASAIIELAESTSGVKDVDASRLEVKDSKQPLTDTVITSKVKGTFIREKLFSEKDIAAMSIKVETNNGIVALSGTAANQQEVDNAIALAKAVNGVKSVTSQIKIAQ